MQASFGSAALALAFLTLVFAAVAALIGRNGDEHWVLISRRAVYGACALLTLCVVLIELAFARVDLSREQWALILGAFLVAAFTIRHLVGQLRAAVEQVERLSRTDQLTGVSNRWAWDEELRLARASVPPTSPAAA